MVIVNPIYKSILELTNSGFSDLNSNWDVIWKAFVKLKSEPVGEEL